MKYKNLVNGEWKESEKEIKIYSPINDEELGSVPSMTREEVDYAMETAKIALGGWRSLAVVERAKYLYKAAEILERDKEIIGTVLAKEVSKGIKAAISEVVRTADLIRYSAEEGLRSVGEIVEGGSFEAASKRKVAMVRKEPMGLVLAIAPFNYPVNLSASKIAPALIGGNVVLFKPPTQGAISGLLLVKAFHEAGVPAGVINTVTGKGSEIGDYLIAHPLVDFINFTGSTPVGKRIGELAGMRPILLELGGKDGAIVSDDADLEKAAKDIVSGAFSYSGQRCTAIKRVLVMESVADKLAVEIMDIIDEFNKNHFNKYCEVSDCHFLLHAQVGIATDVNVSPGTRIPIGEEPEDLIEHLKHCKKFHKYFPSGTGDIFPIDLTVHKNHEYVLDIIKGAMKEDIRYLSFYSSDSDVIRITGYLVKKSEINKLEKGQSVLQDTTALGMGAKHNCKILERKVR